jgi:hypothetical protein
MEERILVVKSGQKFMNIRKNIMYIVKSVKGTSAMLVSEDGEACMIIQADDLVSAGFEPLYD